jgi:hypothetical protein
MESSKMEGSKMKRFVKYLTIDENRNLVSCHGGTMVWRGFDWQYPKEPAAKTLCSPGLLHACRLRDMPQWISTHLVILETDSEPIIGSDKVGLARARIINHAPSVDGLDVLVRFAEYVASGADPDTWVDWIVQQYPAGLFEGVEP